MSEASNTEPAVWNGHTQSQLNAAYNNMAAVPGSAARLASWNERSANLRRRHSGELDQPYGTAPRQHVDFFRCGAALAPLFVFIHGGWWQRNSRQVFSCMAEGPLALGFDVALMGYTLAPEARLSEIVAEIHAGLDMIATGNERQKLILGGWSAGGHLTAMALDHPAVTAGLSISGVFDLEPIRLSDINDKLLLDEAEARAMSPASLPMIHKPLVVAYGTAELPELQRQSRDFAILRNAAHEATTELLLAGEDHFSILEQLATPDGALAKALVKLAAG